MKKRRTVKQADPEYVEGLARSIFVERVASMPLPEDDKHMKALSGRFEEHAFFALEAAEVFVYSAECWREVE